VVGIIWTYDMCKKEALKYNNMTDFIKKSNGSYVASKKNGMVG
jgi:hypothetical protein